MVFSDVCALDFLREKNFLLTLKPNKTSEKVLKKKKILIVLKDNWVKETINFSTTLQNSEKQWNRGLDSL